FKTGLTLQGDNCIDVYTQDAGLIAFVENGSLTGFNLVVGGGMGMTHNKPDTFAALARPLGFLEPDHVVDAVKTVAAIFRDFGNRADRRHARLKYLIAERGMDWFREEFTRRALFPLHEWRAMQPLRCEDHLGLHEQPDGKVFYGVHVPNGRVRDDGDRRIKSALRKIVQEFQPGLILTPQQNILLSGLERDAVPRIERLLEEHGVTPAPRLAPARRFAMACPALPTCGLAMSESERVMPGLLDRLERLLAELGLRDAPISIRMTGCPNGCTRPYTADIAFVGRRPGAYHVYVGGGLPGDRVVDLYERDVPLEEVDTTLRPLLAAWARHRRNGESLSDYYRRVLEHAQPRTTITGKETPTRETFERSIGA
ncbi:MAG: NADPH-dependent assimilatory sulfite reductase hemoprotein subunit, partial [Planctomycetota bacterium]